MGWKQGRWQYLALVAWMAVAPLVACTQTVLVNTPRDEGDEPGECSDGVDNNLDGFVDCLDEGCATADVCVDDDQDGWTEGSGDCDDTVADTYPAADELCDGADNDCDGDVDEGFDQDEDGVTSCGGDCDDTDANTLPGADEVCDGSDNDCDGDVDEGFDEDGDGVTVCGGDCDDGSPDIHPGAEEVCDGLDNDCNDQVDETFDQDGDGVVSCNGDCDDTDPLAYPGAVEVCDGADNDCDGRADETASDQDGDGFAASEDGQPGLACAHVDGAWRLAFSRGDCDDSDASVHPGAEDDPGGNDADCGGTDGPDPHVGFSNSLYTRIQSAIDAAADGQTVWVGSGTYLEHDLTFGGKRITVASSHGPQETVISGQWQGRVVAFEDGEGPDTVLDGFTIRDGQGEYGGGIDFDRASPTVRRCIIADNLADRGAGIYLDHASPLLENVVLTGNVADEEGGAGKFFFSNPTLTNVTIVYNIAGVSGGGLAMYSAAPVITNAILADNWHEDLSGSGSSAPQIRYSVVYNDMGATHDLDALDETVLEVSPQFMYASNDRDSSNDDFHLGPGSALVDAGDPDLLDPDGSRSDIGAYGGPGADMSYYTDTDGDAMYDGWEVARGLDPTSDDAGDDLDGDGADNLMEFLNGSFPDVGDSDGDGYSDGQEYIEDTSPLDWYDRPDGSTEARVPGDFDTVQAAVDAVVTTGTVRIARATVKESLLIVGKRVTLSPGDEGVVPHLAAAGGSAVTAVGADLVIEGVVVEGGYSEGRWGGISLIGSTASLSASTVQDNIGEYGGGLYAYQSTLTVDGVLITHNTAGFGGGLDAVESTVTITSSTFDSNTATAFGGGLSLRSSDVVLDQITVTGNRVSVPDDSSWSSPSGGGIYAYQSSLSATSVTVAENATEGPGGGLYLESSTGGVVDADLSGNSATGRGGGLYLTGSDVELEDVSVSSNVSDDDGGGLALVRSTCTAYNLVVDANSAGDRGGGLFCYQTDQVALEGGGVTANQAAADGGGLAFDTPVVTRLTGVSVSGNVSTGDGGGMFVYGATGETTFSHITLQDNQAGFEGGGLFVSYVTATTPVLSGATVVGNSAAGSGGGLQVTLYATVNLEGGRVASNEAGENGGGIGADDHGSLTLRDVTLDTNVAAQDGGALWADSATIALESGSIEDNEAGGDGAGICATKALALNLENVVLAGNHASGTGGAVHVSDTPDMVWQNVRVDGNEADTGGGVALEGADTSWTGSNIDLTGNGAGTFGGGLVLSGASMAVSGALFADNTAPNGGAAFLESGQAAWRNVVVAGNTATSGAGLLIWDAALDLANGIVAYNAPANLLRVGAEAVNIHYSLFYNDDGSGVSGVALDASNLEVEPGFLTYTDAGLPSNYHLALSSPAVDAGDTTITDQDGSRSDLGMYGGPSGALWDRDFDGAPDYFWPGNISDGPPGWDPSDFDCNDLDREILTCS